MMKFKKFLCMFLAVLMILIACFASFASYAEESGEEYLAEELVTEAVPEPAAEAPIVEETPAETYAPVEETAPTYEETVPEEITSTYEETVPETTAETTPAATEAATAPEENTTQGEEAQDPATTPAADPVQPAADTTPQTEPQQETTPETTASNEAEDTTTQAAPAEEPTTVLEEQTEETTTSSLSWQTLNVVPKDEVIDDIYHPSALWYWVERSWNRHFYRTVSAEKKAAETRIEISGMLPENATATANVIELLEDDTYNIMGLYAYVITIYDAQGSEYVPAEDKPVTIKIRTGEITQALQEGRTVWVYTYTNNATEGQWEYGTVTEWDNVHFETKMIPLYLFVCSYDEFFVSSEETVTEETTTAEETTADPEIIYQTDPEEETTAEEETEVETEEETTPEGPVIEDDKIIYADNNIYLTGSMPADGIVEATPVDVQIEGQVVLAAYDIAIYADEEQKEEGITWQPEEDTVQIHIVDPELSRINNDEVSVFGMENVDAEAELADTAQIEEEEVIVDAGVSSIVVIAQQLLEKTITIGGATYKVMVTYDTAAGIPEGAELSVADVSEDSTENYLEQAADVLGWQEEDSIFYSLVLDIRILYEGEEIQPLTPVTVSVELLDIEDTDVTAVEATQALEVVHFHEDEEGAKVQSLDTVVSAAGTSCDISFETEGFSRFVIAGAYRNVLTSSTDLAEISVQTLNKNLSLEMETIEAEEDILVKGQELLESYVISQEDGSVQNTGSVRANVTLDENISLDELESVNVYSIKDGALEEIISDVMEPGTKVTVSLNGIDGFALVKDTGLRELTLVAEPAIGESILLEGMVPMEAELQAAPVEELPELQDAEKEEPADAETDETFLCAYDISIINSGEKFQPKEGETIRVEITNDAIGQATEAGRRLHIWHITDDGEREEITEFAVKGSTVSFEAEGFSAYAIVDGPAPIDTALAKVKDLTELADNCSYINGFYLSYGSTVYYFTNELNSNDAFIETPSIDNASGWYFEKGDQDNRYYIYTKINGVKHYMKNKGFTGNSNSSGTMSLTTEKSSASQFDLSEVGDNKFYIKLVGANYWLQHSGSGNGIRLYNSNSNSNNSRISITYIPDAVTEDPYDLSSQSFGLMNWTGSLSGRAMMAVSSTENALDAKPLTVMVNKEDNQDKLFVPKDSDITMWTFEWVDMDHYYLTATVEGTTKYLKITSDSLSLVNEVDENCKIKVVPGTGEHSGQICLKAGEKALTYSGSVSTGFTATGSAGNEWLYLVDLSELTTDYFMIHTADKVSVSDPDITNGSKVIVYTRTWNEDTKKYEFYAIDADGSLTRVYESGDSIQWSGAILDTLLWNFVEYYWEGSTDPNYYYELFNEYSSKFIAPQINGDQILSDDPIGINLNGRRNNMYYSTILAWDPVQFKFASLKVNEDNTKIISCPSNEAMDFYFAIIQDIPVDDELSNGVPTVDNNDYGIKMKLVNFNTPTTVNNQTTSSEQAGYFYTNKFDSNHPYNVFSGLLSTNLGDNGYPNVQDGRSLAGLYAGAQVVNHLFIESTYQSSGYYEYDSSQNFASLQSNGNFKVYREIATYDGGDKPSMKHGQFFPYNDLKPGVFATLNGQNLYTATQQTLSDADPRKYERLYNLEHDGKKADCYFGVEIEASFTQTPNGHDNWGHDIIYEFTGDDDFWLYVDGELIIDLGGIHSAVPGSVNYATGEVYVNGTWTTLYEKFLENRTARGESTYNLLNGEDSIFVPKLDSNNQIMKDSHGHDMYVFREYTTHTMRIFYMERGGGASNLHMRFNLASVRPGHVLLSKELEGFDDSETQFSEFAFQVFYKTEDEGGFSPLTDSRGSGIDVYYKDSSTPVPFRSDGTTINGVGYSNVFILKPGETADIKMPTDTIQYYIVECGVDNIVYENVTVKEVSDSDITTTVHGTTTDYQIAPATTNERPRVTFVNTADPSKLGSLSITKKLFKPDEQYQEIPYNPLDEDQPVFNFRLYLAAGLSETLELTNMQTYHVKDPDGYYCIWDSSVGKHVKHASNITCDNYDQQSAEVKESLTFHTSVYGEITNIPNGFTVEVKGLMPGTDYKVVERPANIPDGYSFWKYTQDGVDVIGSDNRFVPAETGVSGEIKTQMESKVEVDNLKGFGLRVYKTWSDEDYMQSREAAYFAVFADHGSNNLVLVDDSVKQMKYGEETLYWYFDALPDRYVSVFENYCIREVTLDEATFDENGNLTGYQPESVNRIDENSTVTLNGKLKGDTTEQSLTYTYTVSYAEPEIKNSVRVDKVTNYRAGISIKKTDWNGAPLSGASFILTLSGTDLVFGPYTSDKSGNVTEAYLIPGREYVLTETEVPKGYFGLQGPLTVNIAAGSASNSLPNVTATKVVDNDTYFPAAGTGNAPAVLTVKNRSMTFKVVKKGGEDLGSAIPIKDVQFALYQEKTVNGITQIDINNPMLGYDYLLSDANGIVEKVDETLNSGTFELHEKAVPSGYQTLSLPHIKFSINKVGSITIDPTTESYVLDGVKLNCNMTNPGTVAYTLEILNHPAVDLTVKKIVTGDGDKEKSFTFRLVSVFRQTSGTKYAWTKYSANGTVIDSTDSAKLDPSATPAAPLTTKSDSNTFTLRNGEYIVIEVPKNKAVTIEEVINENEGYTVSWVASTDEATISGDSTTKKSIKLTDDATVNVTNHKGEVYIAPTGFRTTTTPFLWILLAGLAALAGTVLPILLRKRKEDDE